MPVLNCMRKSIGRKDGGSQTITDMDGAVLPKRHGHGSDVSPPCGAEKVLPMRIVRLHHTKSGGALTVDRQRGGVDALVCAKEAA